MKKIGLILFVIFNFCIFAEEKVDIEKRVEILENNQIRNNIYKESIDGEIKNSIKKIENEYKEESLNLYKEIKDDWSNKKDEIDEIVIPINRKYSFLVWIAGILGVTALGIFIKILYDWTIKIKQIKEQLEEEMKLRLTKEIRKSIKQQIRENGDLIEEIIKERDEEEKLKKNTKIVVISVTENKKSDFLKKLLTEKFSKFDIEKDWYTLENQNQNLSDYSLIIFDNEVGDKENHGKFNNLVKAENQSYFYYCLTQGVFFKTETTTKLHYSKAKATVYENIISLLRVKDII